MNPKISVNVEGYTVKARIIITVCDAEGNDVLNLKPRDYEYGIEKAHIFYLRKIRNFVSKALANPTIILGKTTRAKWEAIQNKIETYFSAKNIPLYTGTQEAEVPVEDLPKPEEVVPVKTEEPDKKVPKKRTTKSETAAPKKPRKKVTANG